MYTSEIELLKRMPENRLIEISQDIKVNNTDTDKVTAAILDADTLIDSYLAYRYTVPFTTIPALVSKLSNDISLYNLYATKYDNEMPAEIKNRYEKAINMLISLQKGETILVNITQKSSGANMILSNKTEEDKIYNSDLLAII